MSAPEPKPPRKRRRVTTEPKPGTDPTPAPEPPRHQSDENDERLKADKPPHWARWSYEERPMGVLATPAPTKLRFVGY